MNANTGHAQAEPQEDAYTYDGMSVDEVVHAITGDEGEDDSVTLLKRLAFALKKRAGGKTVWALLDELEALQPEADQANSPLVVRTAPESIWLEVSDDPSHKDNPFPRDPHGGEVTWSKRQALECAVPYVRADLAGSCAAGLQAREGLTAAQRLAMWTAATIEQPSPQNCYDRGVIDAERHYGIGLHE